MKYYTALLVIGLAFVTVNNAKDNNLFFASPASKDKQERQPLKGPVIGPPMN